MNGIPESDWKVLRKQREIWLNRFCESVLQDVQKASSAPAKSAHERYLEIYRLIDDRDDAIAAMFNHNSRSKAHFLLLGAHRRQLITPDELRQFTAETQAFLNSFAKDFE